MKISRTLHLGAPLTSVFLTADEVDAIRKHVPSTSDRYSIRRRGQGYAIVASKSAPSLRATNSPNMYHLRQSRVISDAEADVLKDMEKTPNLYPMFERLGSVPTLYKAIPADWAFANGKGYTFVEVHPDWSKVKPYAKFDRAEEGKRVNVKQAPTLVEKPDDLLSIQAATVNKTTVDNDTTAMEVTTALALMSELRERYALTYFITPEGNVEARRVIEYK